MDETLGGPPGVNGCVPVAAPGVCGVWGIWKIHTKDWFSFCLDFWLADGVVCPCNTFPISFIHWNGVCHCLCLVGTSCSAGKFSILTFQWETADSNDPHTCTAQYTHTIHWRMCCVCALAIGNIWYIASQDKCKHKCIGCHHNNEMNSTTTTTTTTTLR